MEPRAKKKRGMGKRRYMDAWTAAFSGFWLGWVGGRGGVGVLFEMRWRKAREG